MSHAPYSTADELELAWRELFSTLPGAMSEAGRSVEGRALARYDFGTRGQPTVLLTALMHGCEVVGSLGMYAVVRWLLSDEPRAQALRERAHFVALPVVNPDTLRDVLAHVGRGHRSGRRCNANGVDLNRNFPLQTTQRPWNPLSGSRHKWSPYYMGTAPLCEPEARAVRDVALAERPTLALAFHSFGNLLLYPWAHTRTANPRKHEYEALGAAMRAAQPYAPYRVKQAHSLYPVLGDLDDWLDAELGSLAFTVEVSQIDRRLLHPRRFINPFWWFNPLDVQRTQDNLVPGVAALLTAAFDIKNARAAS